LSLVTPRKGYKSVPWYFGKEIEIPDEWEIVKLKELVVRGNQGINTAIDKVEYVDKGIPILKAGDIKQNLELSNTSNISQKSYESVPEHHKPKKNDILYSNIGSALGTAMLVTVDTKMTIAWNVFRMVIKKNQNSKYLIYFLNKYDIWNMLKSRATQSTMPFISKPVLLSLNILLPPLSEQQKITSILSNVDNLIESTVQVITHSKKVKTGLMQKLLTRGIGHKKFKKVKWLFGKEIEIPEEWNWEQIKKVSEKLVVGFVGTCDPYYVKKGGIPMLRTTNVKEGKLDLINLKYVTEQFHNKNKKSQIKENDLLISRHGESGESCLVTGLNEANCMNIVIVRAINKILDNQYFEIAFNSLIVRKQIRRTIAGGVQGVVNTSEIAKVKILLPPLPEQQKIASILSNIDSKITSQEQYKEKLERLKKSLMQKLLTGMVRV
jgi:type I restriction enzyme, S subunit